MTYIKQLIIICLPLLLAGIGQAQAGNILATPATMPVVENGQAWVHPTATLVGIGELKFENGGSNVPKVRYEGKLVCRVSASAATQYKNELEIRQEGIARDIEAKSRSGSISISNCSLIGADGVSTPIAESANLSGGKIEVEIEGYYQNASGSLVFSEYEAEGKVSNGSDMKVKLELKNGRLSTFIGCIPPNCGGGVPL